LIDSVARLIPGVLADAACHEIESISCGMLEYPQYTHPEVFCGQAVPKVLLSGNHKEIEKWRHEKALELTKEQRPDLI
jgi:tRNA (guanine37-N1)-methyltransferase